MVQIMVKEIELMQYENKIEWMYYGLKYFHIMSDIIALFIIIILFMSI